MSKGSKKQTQTQTNEPWSAQQPYLKQTFAEAQKLYQDPSLSQWHGLGPMTTDATQGAVGAARAGTGQDLLGNAGASINKQLGGAGITGLHGSIGQLGGPGRSALESAAGGDYLNNNPYINNVLGAATGRITENFQDQVLPGVASQLGMAGAAGGSAHQNMLAKTSGEYMDAIGRTSADILGNNYARERGLQMQAAGTLGQQDLALGAQNLQADQNAISAYGTEANARNNMARTAGALDALQQARGDRDIRLAGLQDKLADTQRNYDLEKWQYNQRKPWENLGLYSGIINQAPAAGTATMKGNRPSGGIAGGLGGAAAGAGIASALSLSNPLTAAFAVGGGLLGSK